MPRLLIQHGGENSRVFELLGERPISIGRAKSSTIVLDDTSVSRLHAIVSPNLDGQWQIMDRESSNGLKVNGAKVKEATLRADDEIMVGEFHLRFEDSKSRKLVSYGTTELPPKVVQVLKASAYSGSLMSVEAVAIDSLPDGAHRAGASAGAGGNEAESRLLKILGRASKALAGLDTLEAVTQRSLDLVLDIEGAERAYVMLVDDASMAHGDFSAGNYSFEPASIRYRSAKPAGTERLPQFTMSQSIIRQVMQDGLPLLISDAKSDPRVSASKSIAIAGIQSAMCAPLGIGKKLRGLLYLDNLSRRGMFTVDDLNAFAVIAVQAGLAINRVRTRNETPEHVRQ
ncbi:MAG TPA: FHA domain-containing protein [Candidatus Acidoferrales bacterium]|nr:FHA domain-containing protein [Candidatus Acidoferrales bacterium]